MNSRNVMPFSTNLYKFQANNLQTTFSFHNQNHSHNHNRTHSPVPRAICRMHCRAVHLTVHNNHVHNHLSSFHIQRTNLQSSLLQHKRF